MADAKMTGALLGAMLCMLSGACPAAGAGGGEEPLADIFLCGDVMTGRGIDQILAHPADPVLYERYVKDARRYIRIAEQESGRPSDPETWSSRPSTGAATGAMPSPPSSASSPTA